MTQKTTLRGHVARGEEFFLGVRAGWMPECKEGATKFQKGNLHMSVVEAGRRRPVQSETKASDVCACACVRIMCLGTYTRAAHRDQGDARRGHWFRFAQ
jgi:hypothetical protein